MKAERFVGNAIVEHFIIVGIDMIHHAGYASLGQGVRTGSFGKNLVDQLMIEFECCFLVRAVVNIIIHPGFIHEEIMNSL